MATEQTSDGSSGSSAARLLIDQIQRERRSFWGILSVFFLLLGGIGAMILYNTVRLSDVERERAAAEFRNIGETAEALSDLRNELNTSRIEQKRSEMERVASQRMIGASVNARTQTPEQNLPIALAFARKHFLGEPLNMSTGSIVAVAMAAANGTDALLLESALADWNKDDARLEAAARRLADSTDLNALAIGHAALAALNFGRVEPPEVNFAWDKGCEAVVRHVDVAMESGIIALAAGFSASGDTEATALNLDYWRGQCLRKRGEPAQALTSFERMLTTAGATRDENPFKFQAYHGKGTVMTAMIDEPGLSPEQRNANLAEAETMLRRAGELRIKNGATEIGAFGSTENIGFLLLRGNDTDRLVRVLEHTGEIDAQLSQTWNLVVRLAAAQELSAMEFPTAFKDPELQAQFVELRSKYGALELKRIINVTKAKLARRTAPSLSMPELKKLLGPEHEWALGFAETCIAKGDGCRELDPADFAPRPAPPPET